MNSLAIAQQIQLHGIPFRTANAIDELSPVLNFLAIHGLDGIAFLQSGVVGWAARSYFVKHGKQRRIAKQTITCWRNRQAWFAPCAARRHFLLRR